MRQVLSLVQIIVLLCSNALIAVAAEKIAYLQDSEVFVIDENHREGRQLTESGIPKWLVRWSPSGQAVAYAEMTEPSVAKGRVIVVNQNGEIRTNVLIHEASGQRVAGFRWIEDIIWFTDDSLGIYGSFNPNHCELIILKVSTGAILRDVALACDSFAVSPDGEHVAYLESVEAGPDNIRRDFVLLDDKQSLLPRGDDTSVTVVGSLEWSADSARIAFVAKATDDGYVSLITADQTGMVNKQDISPSFGDRVDLAWSDSSLIVHSDNLTITVDPRSRNWRAASAEEGAVVERASRIKTSKVMQDSRRVELEAQRGWRSADVWTNERLGP